MPAKKQSPAKTKSAPATKKQTRVGVDKNLSLDQLSGKIRELRGDLIRQLNQIRAGASGNVRRPGQIRRQIARHLTAANQRRRQKGDTPDKTEAKPAPAAKTKPAPKTTPKKAAAKKSK